jgi:hypothetical protein
MSFRLAARVDDNHAEIVAAFRKLGCSVLDIHQLKNCADLIVSKNKRTVIVEVKDGKKPKSARHLTAGEREFFAGWRGESAIVESIDDVVRVVDEMRA